MNNKYYDFIKNFHDSIGINDELIKKIKIPIHKEEKNIIFAEIGYFNINQFLEFNTYKAWFKMKKAAKENEIFLTLVSGYRSYFEQAFILLDELRKGVPIESLITRVAPVGYSEHHTGTAIDIGQLNNYDPIVANFEETDSFLWLLENASKFGFSMSYPKNNPNKIIYEPWHWKYSY
jgi:D-alanyl-D-alanine carboxypeptidase